MPLPPGKLLQMWRQGGVAALTEEQQEEAIAHHQGGFQPLGETVIDIRLTRVEAHLAQDPEEG